MAAYETLRTAIYDERIIAYRVPMLERELAQLEFGEGKVNHPRTTGGSKDLADALAGAVQHCEKSWRAAEGSRGLFKFGTMETESGGLREKMQQKIAAVYARVATGGEPLNEQDEDRLLFSQFFNDLFDDKKGGA